MLDDILGAARRSIPKPLFRLIERPYHFLLAWAGARRYGFPSRRIAVIAVTGTKGKSSTTEILNAILEKAGLKTALSNTIRFKIGGTSRPNLYKMEHARPLRACKSSCMKPSMPAARTSSWR